MTAERIAELLKKYGHIESHPRLGLSNDLYSWDASEKAVIRKSDLLAARAAEKEKA